MWSEKLIYSCFTAWLLCLAELFYTAWQKQQRGSQTEKPAQVALHLNCAQCRLTADWLSKKPHTSNYHNASLDKFQHKSEAHRRDCYNQTYSWYKTLDFFSHIKTGTTTCYLLSGCPKPTFLVLYISQKNASPYQIFQPASSWNKSFRLRKHGIVCFKTLIMKNLTNPCNSLCL